NKSLFPGLRNLASWFVNSIEKTSHPAVDHYFFAERSYPFEFPYIKNFTILENKFGGEITKREIKTIDPENINFIISGTITPVYGIEKAIGWFLELLKERPGLSLTVLGHVPISSFRKKIQKKVS